MLSASAGTAPLHGPNKSAFAALKSTLWPERTFASFVDGKQIEVLTTHYIAPPQPIGASSAKGGGVFNRCAECLLSDGGAPGRADSPTVSWTWGRCSKPAESEEETNGRFHELDIDLTAPFAPGHTSERDNNIRATTTSAAF
ncbi:hypothetical protein QR685DRAFT_568953 [Neurospora intermedia]|uniref:Uncharacterized protein n=1 Tax=Neurospora intermedia TaxID=5142 RepID=A0ABR3DJC3_NEUIN